MWDTYRQHPTRSVYSSCTPVFWYWSLVWAISSWYPHHWTSLTLSSYLRYPTHYNVPQIWGNEDGDEMRWGEVSEGEHAYSINKRISFSFCFNFLRIRSRPMIQHDEEWRATCITQSYNQKPTMCTCHHLTERTWHRMNNNKHTQFRSITTATIESHSMVPTTMLMILYCCYWSSLSWLSVRLYASCHQWPQGDEWYDQHNYRYIHNACLDEVGGVYTEERVYVHVHVYEMSECDRMHAILFGEYGDFIAHGWPTDMRHSQCCFDQLWECHWSKIPTYIESIDRRAMRGGHDEQHDMVYSWFPPRAQSRCRYEYSYHHDWWDTHWQHYMTHDTTTILSAT